jgi:hypothetical protein
MTVELFGHLAKEFVAAKGSAGICGGTERFVALAWGCAEEVLPVGTGLPPLPFHIEQFL